MARSTQLCMVKLARLSFRVWVSETSCNFPLSTHNYSYAVMWPMPKMYNYTKMYDKNKCYAIIGEYNNYASLTHRKKFVRRVYIQW